MTTSRFWQHRVVRHLIGWGLLLGLIELGLHVVPIANTTQRQLFILLSLVLLAVPIYTYSWLAMPLLAQGRYGRCAAITVAVVLGGTLLDVATSPLQIALGNKDQYYTLKAAFDIASNLVFALLAATGLHYLRRSVLSYFQVPRLRAQQVETELSLLKAQVNQHFLFNTLNNLYGLSLTAPEQMPEALLQLADLMRYQLDSSRQRLVTVGTEATYLANYIGLEKLRLRSNTQVEFVTDLPHPDLPLAPLLLLPLVENCFKHAIGPSGDNTIRIQLTQTDAGLTLRTDNTIPPHFRPQPSGLGLPNLRARLTQFYPHGRHRLLVEVTEAHYRAVLHLAATPTLLAA